MAPQAQKWEYTVGDNNRVIIVDLTGERPEPYWADVMDSLHEVMDGKSNEGWILASDNENSAKIPIDGIDFASPDWSSVVRTAMEQKLREEFDREAEKFSSVVLDFMAGDTDCHCGNRRCEGHKAFLVIHALRMVLLEKASRYNQDLTWLFTPDQTDLDNKPKSVSSVASLMAILGINLDELPTDLREGLQL